MIMNYFAFLTFELIELNCKLIAWCDKKGRLCENNCLINESELYNACSSTAYSFIIYIQMYIVQSYVYYFTTLSV